MVARVNELRNAGVSADMSYGGRGLKGAMKGADRANARFALVLGESGARRGRVQVMISAHEQRAVALSGRRRRTGALSC